MAKPINMTKKIPDTSPLFAIGTVITVEDTSKQYVYAKVEKGSAVEACDACQVDKDFIATRTGTSEKICNAIAAYDMAAVLTDVYGWFLIGGKGSNYVTVTVTGEFSGLTALAEYSTSISGRLQSVATSWILASSMGIRRLMDTRLKIVSAGEFIFGVKNLGGKLVTGSHTSGADEEVTCNFFIPTTGTSASAGMAISTFMVKPVVFRIKQGNGSWLTRCASSIVTGTDKVVLSGWTSAIGTGIANAEVEFGVVAAKSIFW